MCPLPKRYSKGLDNSGAYLRVISIRQRCETASKRGLRGDLFMDFHLTKSDNTSLRDIVQKAFRRPGIGLSEDIVKDDPVLAPLTLLIRACVFAGAALFIASRRFGRRSQGAIVQPN